MSERPARDRRLQVREMKVAVNQPLGAYSPGFGSELLDQPRRTFENESSKRSPSDAD